MTELLTLHAVRLAGLADEEAVLDRALLGDQRVREALQLASADGLVQHLTVGEHGGWVLTAGGSSHLGSLLAQEVDGADAHGVLAATLEEFEVINGPFVKRVARWQLRSTSGVARGFDSADDAAVAALLAGLAESGAELRRVLADLTPVLPRFGRYPAQFAAALERAHLEGLRWITGVGRLSCHTVWAEVHQDLLSSLGRTRSTESAGQP